MIDFQDLQTHLIRIRDFTSEKERISMIRSSGRLRLVSGRRRRARDLALVRAIHLSTMRRNMLIVKVEAILLSPHLISFKTDIS